MIAQLVQVLVGFARGHAWLAYALAFLLAGAEAFPVVGALVPGTATIIALGALVPAGALLFWPLVVFATLGAIAGDGLSYWLGSHYKSEAISHWPLRHYSGLVDRGNAFFEKHGGKAILIARFTPGVRAVVPVVAGITGMPITRFYALNVLSALLWGPAHVLMGVLVGASLTVLGAIAGQLEALFLGLLLGVAILVWITPRVLRWLRRFLGYLHGPVLAWAQSGDSWVRRQVISILDPGKAELPGLAVLGGLLVVSLWLFFGVMQDLIAGDPLVQADRSVLNLLLSLRMEWAAHLAVGMSELGGAPEALAVLAIALLWLDRRRAWRAMAYVIAAAAGAILFAIGLDLALKRPQPLYRSPGWGLLPFPGTHLALFVALLGFLAVLVCREVAWRRQVGVAFAIVLFVASLAGSQLYLGAEYLSTALEVLAFGTAWAALLSIAYLARPTETVRPAGLGLAVTLTFALAGTVNVAIAHTSDMRRYALTPHTVTFSVEDWLGGQWRSLPARRLSLLGSFNQPFTVQWLGPLGPVQADLQRHGWRLPVSWRLLSALAFLSPHPSMASLPVLPSFESGRMEAMAMIKTGGNIPNGERLVLRLWRSDVVIPVRNNPPQPLYIGTVGVERTRRIISTVNMLQDVRGANSVLVAFAAAIPGARFVLRPGQAAVSDWSGPTVLALAPGLASTATPVPHAVR